MFRKLIELFGSENLLDSAYKTMLTMLEMDLKMFEASCHSLRRADNAELPLDIKKTDRQINKLEREVRRNVLTHLSIAGTQNVVPGLVLVSIVIDVERLGDYTKNISELATMHPSRLEGGPYEESIKEIETAIGHSFPTVLELLKTQDEAEARKVLDVEDEIGKAAESIVSSLILDQAKGLPVDDAVCLALYVRHLKRTNAHLTNIASAVVNPFPRLGFRAKDPEEGIN